MHIFTAQFLKSLARTSGLLLPFLSGATALAAGKGHAAHSHGEAKLNLVAEGKKLTVQFESPSESIYGFEHEAKTAADIKTRDAAGEKFRANIDKMILLDPKLECVFKIVKLDLHVKPKSAHSETQAEVVADCKLPLAGTKVSFGFTKIFPQLRNIEVQALSGEKQVGAEIKKDRGSVLL